MYSPEVEIATASSRPAPWPRIAISTSGDYTRVPVKKSMPVYITYFTMARDIDGELKTFTDIYGRDAPVLASFNAPRVGNRSRVTNEEVIEIVDDLQTS